MRLTRFLSRLRDDSGAAMAAVIGLMLVIAVVSVGVLSTSVSSASFSTSARANVQSNAAADAGVDVAFAAIYNGDYSCAFVSQPGTLPRYEVSVDYKNSAGVKIDCSRTNSSEKTSVKTAVITSKGFSDGTAVGTTSGSSARVVANAATNQIASTTAPTQVPGDLPPSGPAIYSYSAASFAGSGTLKSVNGSAPQILIKTGDVTCSGAAQNGVVDFVVGGGSLDQGGSCDISGNVWATKRVTMSGAVETGGNVVAPGLTMSGSSTVDGNVWSASDITLSGATRIGGNATAESLDVASSSTINGSAWIYGATGLNSWGQVIGGNLTTKTLTVPNYSSGQIRGSITQTNPNRPGASPWATPTMPTVPGWVDYTYDETNWRLSGFTVFKTLSGSCNYSQLVATLGQIGTAKGVILATGCSNGIQLSGVDKLNLTGDVAIIANQFNFSGSSGFTASAGAKKLWLINPDAGANASATCAANESFTMSGAFSQASNIAMLAYSPCAINIASGLNIYGQVYGGRVDVSGAATISYSPIGLPGYNLGTGAPQPAGETVPGTTTYSYTATLTSRLDVAGS